MIAYESIQVQYMRSKRNERGEKSDTLVFR